MSNDSVWSDGKFVPIKDILKDRATGYSKGASFEVLRELYKRARTTDELVKLTGRGKSTVYLVLREKLEKNGWVFRKQIEGKILLWSLTPTGVGFVRKLLKTSLTIKVKDSWKAPTGSLESRILRTLKNVGQKHEDYLKSKLKVKRELLENTLIVMEQKGWLEKSSDKFGKALWDLSEQGIFEEALSYTE